ncbi:MAG: hemerythrin domain-containing protein [Frankia sp.]|nr:hemerythrin domain-containing protein [Frankia sp.]
MSTLGGRERMAPVDESRRASATQPIRSILRGRAGGRRRGPDAGSRARPTPASEPAHHDEGGPLLGAVGPVHRDADRLLGRTAAVPIGQADPRQVLRTWDAAIALVSAHLATVDRYIYPRARRWVPRWDERLAQLRSGALEIQTLMRGVQQYAQGDPLSPHVDPADLQRQLRAALAEHVRAEEALLRDIERAAPAEELSALVAEYERRLPRAPSRPHPHLFRHRAFGHQLGHRMVAWWDGVLDAMDSRVVSGAPVRPPGKVGLWGAWLLGRPPTAQRGGERPAAPGGWRPMAGPAPGEKAAGRGGRPAAAPDEVTAGRGTRHDG